MQVSHKSAYLLRHSVRRTGSVCGHYLHPCFIHILEHCQMKSMPSFTEPSEYPVIVHNSQVAEHALTKATPPPSPLEMSRFLSACSVQLQRGDASGHRCVWFFLLVSCAVCSLSSTAAWNDASAHLPLNGLLADSYFTCLANAEKRA